MPNFLNDALGAFIGFFTCTRKKRCRDQAEILEEENLFYQNKKRRLNGPNFSLGSTPPRKDFTVNNIFSKNIFSQPENKRTLYSYSDNRKSFQTLIIKGSKQDEIFLSKISNLNKNNSRRKIDFEEEKINPLLLSNQKIGLEYIYNDEFYDKQKIIDLENSFLNKQKENEIYDSNEEYIKINENNNYSTDFIVIKEHVSEEIIDICDSPYTKPHIVDSINFPELQEIPSNGIIELGDSEIIESNESRLEQEQEEQDILAEEEIRNNYEYLINSVDLNNREKRNFPDIEYEKFVKFRKLLNCKYKDYKYGSINNKLNISRSSICKLSPGCWLNDEVINTYVDLINERNEEKQSDFNYPNICVFNTFFYEKYSSSKSNNTYSYQQMSKFWEKKNINLYNCKYIMIPVNIYNSHWSLVVANICERRLTFFDSLHHPTEGFKIMNSLAELFSEYIERNKIKEEDGCFYNNDGVAKTTLQSEKDEDQNCRLSASFASSIINMNEGNLQINSIEESENLVHEKRVIVNSNALNSSSEKDSDSEIDLHLLSSFWKFKMAITPKQNNGSDCGVYVCKFMDYLSRDIQNINFTHEDVYYFRYLIAIEILEGKLMSY